MIQQQKKPSKEDLGEMNPLEVQLILYIRERFRYGELTIKTRDGLPVLILKSTEYQSLDG
jgi:hypothetical protein